MAGRHQRPLALQRATSQPVCGASTVSGSTRSSRHLCCKTLASGI